LPVSYFHIVFTLPHELSALTLQNKRLLYDLLFQASAATLLELARDPKHLGAEIGFLGVLHTWGQNLQHHPHVHYIVPALQFAGGDTQVLPVRHGMKVAQPNCIYGASRILPIATSTQPALEYIKDVVREHYQVLLWSIRTDQDSLRSLRCKLVGGLGNLTIFAITTEKAAVGVGKASANAHLGGAEGHGLRSSKRSSGGTSRTR
jgi:hypothetical protein